MCMIDVCVCACVCVCMNVTASQISSIMFNQPRQFNIISGEKTQNISQRTLSCAAERRVFTQSSQLEPLKATHLGQPRDAKHFQYGYSRADITEKPTKSLTMASSKTTDLRMLNSVSTSYNIITHAAQNATSLVVGKESPVANINRKTILAQMIHKGRLLAPNYHQDYHERQQRREFARKKGLCDGICAAQKSYGQVSFRKFK